MLSYEINNKILPALLRIEANKTRLEGATLNSAAMRQIKEQNRNASAEVVVKLLGKNLPKAAISNAVFSDDNFPLLRVEEEVRNNYKALIEIDKALSKHKPFSRQLVTDIYEKISPENCAKMKDAWKEKTSTKKYESEMKVFNELENYVIHSLDHPLVKAAVLHYEISNFHYGEFGNAVDEELENTGRILGEFILGYFGYGFENLSPLSVIFSLDVNEYHSKLRNAEAWVDYYIRCVEIMSMNVMEMIRDTSADALTKKLANLSDGEAALFKYLLKQNIRRFAPIDLVKKTKVSNRTIAIRAKGLCEQGFLVADSSGDRVRSYSLSNYSVQNKWSLEKWMTER